MSEKTRPQPGSFCWTELMTRDAATAKKFYAELIGWNMAEENIEGQPYTLLTPPGATEPVGGMMQMEGPQFEGVPPHWMPYIAVDDIDATAKRCTELGGQVKVPPTQIADIGSFCVIQDPTGAVISLFQAR